ncbi:hypothetical protein [Ensifer sp. Root31]|uniref:hypothetical protein n=1 Tax=Ensifer sp. Root31 TaxID=1736512 RepID=UPI0012E891C7|nr:hypothetical protein [Ensifer sp. Root31]
MNGRVPPCFDEPLVKTASQVAVTPRQRPSPRLNWRKLRFFEHSPWVFERRNWSRFAVSFLPGMGSTQHLFDTFPSRDSTGGKPSGHVLMSVVDDIDHVGAKAAGIRVATGIEIAAW